MHIDLLLSRVVVLWNSWFEQSLTK